jgi:hypothetical protein
VGSPSVDDLRDEQRRLRCVRFIVDLTTSVLMQGDLARREGEALVAATRARILDLFPGREETYEILYARRFATLLEGCTRRDAAESQNRVLPFRRRDEE